MASPELQTGSTYFSIWCVLKGRGNHNKPLMAYWQEIVSPDLGYSVK